MFTEHYIVREGINTCNLQNDGLQKLCLQCFDLPMSGSGQLDLAFVRISEDE